MPSEVGGRSRLMFEESRAVVNCASGAFRVSGADHAEQVVEGLAFHRLPRQALRRVRQPFMRAVEAQPTGVRLSFVTSADAVTVALQATALTFFPDDRPTSFGMVDLYADGVLVATQAIEEGGVRMVEFGGARTFLESGPVAELRFDGLGTHAKSLELWLPHDVEATLVDVGASAPIAVPPADTRRRWVHYGSSISHGMDATHPSLTWPAVAARIADVQLINLGFAGNAVLDQYVARAIRDQPADVISAKIGINVLDFDGFRTRTFVSAVDAFLDTVREGHPSTPLWVLSPILSPAVEDRPGPVVLREVDGRMMSTTDGRPEEIVRGRLSAQSIRALLADLIAERSTDDPHLRYLDGRALYGESDALSTPLPDGSHPDAPTHHMMGTRFAEHLDAAG